MGIKEAFQGYLHKRREDSLTKKGEAQMTEGEKKASELREVEEGERAEVKFPGRIFESTVSEPELDKNGGVYVHRVKFSGEYRGKKIEGSFTMTTDQQGDLYGGKLAGYYGFPGSISLDKEKMHPEDAYNFVRRYWDFIGKSIRRTKGEMQARKELETLKQKKQGENDAEIEVLRDKIKQQT